MQFAMFKSTRTKRYGYWLVVCLLTHIIIYTCALIRIEWFRLEVDPNGKLSCHIIKVSVQFSRGTTTEIWSLRMLLFIPNGLCTLYWARAFLCLCAGACACELCMFVWWYCIMCCMCCKREREKRHQRSIVIKIKIHEHKRWATTYKYSTFIGIKSTFIDRNEISTSINRKEKGKTENGKEWKECGACREASKQ